MGQGTVQTTQPDPGREAEVLGVLLHGIGGEITLGSGSVGEGPLAAEGENGSTAWSGWKVARI